MGIAASLITLKLHGERSTCSMCYAKEGNYCFHYVQRAGHFILTDFGIAKSATGQRMMATRMSVGTPRYMSPEQARAKELDGRSDIYSLGE